MRSKVRLLLPRRTSWMLCYDGMEMSGGAQEGAEGQAEVREADGILQQRYERLGDVEADRWLGEEVVAGWRMAGRALHQRVSVVRMMFSMWLTEDVVARWADHLTDAERTGMSRCAMCGEEAKGRRNEHLLFECTISMPS